MTMAQKTNEQYESWYAKGGYFGYMVAPVQEEK